MGGITNVEVPLYKSRVLATRGAVRKVSIGNPEIADVLVTNPRELYLLGRSLGSTNVLLWDGSGKLIDSLDLEVVHDLSALKTKLHELMPNEKISVFSAQGALVLRGQVSSAAAMDTAVKVAKTYTAQSQSIAQGKAEEASAAPSKSLDVINLLTVGGSQQVMLEVKVAEMQRSLFKSLNVRFNALDFGSSSRWSTGGFNNGQGLGFDEDGLLNPTTMFGDGKGILGQFLSDEFLFNMVLEASKDNGSAKVLAEPTLTTLTGQQAEFISGGEFPVPVTEDDGITIEYKEFGVGVKFLPVVLDSGRINLNLNVSVSELSNTNALALDTGIDSVLGEGVAQIIPSLTKRSAQSTVELGNGQTIAIAGLINENTKDLVSRFPGLGDLPVLGHLFRSQQFQSGETELVILVTPHLAKPIDARTVRLPTERFVEPSDLDFYLLGKTKGNGPGRSVPVSLGVSEGNFGHDLD
ncbi:type II and III secretion system protein family protein [Pseudomonas sp. GCM10022188]|uniref:type II and III secretion system protein family protein n=1 Tax=Pseudomonas TaxID=286 RepID=UPI001E61FE95|nr:type II and III secretion system protein family protein [Pseudomonas oryzagri]MCC6075949.1 type II and III secretion system protein family protein [Pseudomonas oryzagri]